MPATAGQKILASDFPDWTSFTTTWSSTGTAPSLGNGTLTARVRRRFDLTEVYINLTWGSTTSGGTGNWQFTLPDTPLNDRDLLPANVIDNSAAFGWATMARLATTSPHILRVHVNGANVTATAPMTWATTDTLTIHGSYEV